MAPEAKIAMITDQQATPYTVPKRIADHRNQSNKKLPAPAAHESNIEPEAFPFFLARLEAALARLSTRHT